MSPAVSWKRRTDIFFLDTDVRKVDSARYIRLLAEELLMSCRLLYPGTYSFLQGGGQLTTSDRRSSI